MRTFLLLVAIALAVPPPAHAAPIGFATFIDLAVAGTTSVVASQFFSPTDTRTNANAFGGLPGAPPQGTSLFAFGQVDLTQAALRAQNRGTGVVNQGVATTTLLYDTITYDGSAFQGVFGASHQLLLTATFTGTYASSNIFGLGSATISSGGVGGRIHVYDGSTVVDSSVFNSSNSLANFLFFGGPTPLCANGVSGPDLATFSGGPFTFSVSCLVTVTAASPSLRIFMNMPSFINATSASWDLNMLNTGTLSANFGGRLVYSASGVFPGTEPQPAPVPEPATLGLVGAGLLVAARRVRSRFSRKLRDS
jgi:hypothetical protein